MRLLVARVQAIQLGKLDIDLLSETLDSLQCMVVVRQGCWLDILNQEGLGVEALIDTSEASIDVVLELWKLILDDQNVLLLELLSQIDLISQVFLDALDITLNGLLKLAELALLVLQLDVEVIDLILENHDRF